MIKYLKFPFLRAGFAGIELILLVTMAVGIFAAAKLSQQPQNLQKQAATQNQWFGKITGLACTTDPNGAYKSGTKVNQIYLTGWGCTLTHGQVYIPPSSDCTSSSSNCYRLDDFLEYTILTDKYLYKQIKPSILSCTTPGPNEWARLYRTVEECELIPPSPTPSLSPSPSPSPTPSPGPYISPTPNPCMSKDGQCVPSSICASGDILPDNGYCMNDRNGYLCCKKSDATPTPKSGKWITENNSTCYTSDSSKNYYILYSSKGCSGTEIYQNDSNKCSDDGSGTCYKLLGSKSMIVQSKKLNYQDVAACQNYTGTPTETGKEKAEKCYWARDNCGSFQDCIGKCTGHTDWGEDCAIYTIRTTCEYYAPNCKWEPGAPDTTPPPGGGPPDGNPPPGGDVCGIYSNTKCTGRKVGEVCDGSTVCTSDGSLGGDDHLVCKCNTGGNGPPPGGGFSCSSLTLDKTAFKPNETATLTSTASEEATDFFFVLYNTLTGQPACVIQGGDIITDTAGCPAGTHKLIFKDANTTSRLTGTRSLTLNDVNFKDMFIWQPNGGYLRYLTFKAFMAKSGGAWTAENPACNQSAEIYRPAVCLNSSIDKKTLNPDESLNITLNGQAPAGTSITKYTAAFYNGKNLYGPSNPKPIVFEGSHFSISSDSATLNIKYDDLNKADENNNNELPTNIQINGYFHLSDGGFSEADPNCVEQFNIVRADGSITPTPSDLTPTPSDLTPTPSDLTPTPSDLTPTPSDVTPTPSEDWWAPDGKKCDGINFITLNNDPQCNVPVGYITDSTDINGGEENKCVTGTPCYKAGGVIIDPGEEAKFQSRSDIPDNCDPIEPGNLPPGTIYDQLLNCSYREAPKGSIQVKVKVSWEKDDEEEDKAKVSEDRPFKFLRIYLQDTSPEPDNFLAFFDKTEGFQNGGFFIYTFTPLFNDITYEVYVKAFDNDNQPIDADYNQGSCDNVACSTKPNGELLEFELKFLDPLRAASAQELNFLFDTMVNKWINNQASPLDISRFIRRLTQVPGLQKNTCDPKVPGGCTFK